MSTLPPQSLPKPRRRWYQYGLRTLMLLMLAVCLFCGWIGYLTKVYQGRASTLKRIADLGGSYEVVPKGPAWLRRIIGEDYVHVAKVRFSEKYFMPSLPLGRLPTPSPMPEPVFITAEDCKQLARLAGMAELDIAGCMIDSAGLPHLAQLHDLVKLTLRGVAFTEPTTTLVLHHMPRLKHVNVSGGAWSSLLAEQGLQETLEVHIDDVASLESLFIRYARVDLRRLRGVQRLFVLALMLDELSDDARQDLSDLPGLKSADLSDSRIDAIPFANSPLVALNLEGTRTDDLALEQVLRFQKLHFLSLSNTPVTDDGLRRLRNLPELCLLDLRGTAVTAEGAAQLKGHDKLQKIQLDGNLR